MALAFTRHLKPLAVVYDCMDELSAFGVRRRRCGSARRELLRRADVVFTGGQSLYEAKRHRIRNVHPFPSSVDVRAFRAARGSRSADPADQARDPASAARLLRRHRRAAGPRAAREVAALRPDWQLVLLGPVVKIDPAIAAAGAEHPLPRAEAVRRSCRRTSPAGTSRCCRSRATRRRASSARPRRPSTWRPGNRSSRRRSATSCARTGSRASCGSPTRRRVRRRDRRGAARGAAARHVAADAFLTPDVVGRHLGAHASADRRRVASSAHVASAAPARVGRVRRVASARRHRRVCRRPDPDGSPMFDYLVVGAGFAGSVLAERLAPRRRQEGADLSTSARTSAATPTTTTTSRHPGPQVRPAHLPHQLARGLRVPVAVHRLAAVPAPRARQVDGQLVPIPINLDTLNQLYGLNLTSFELEEFFESVAEPRDADPDVGGRDRQQGRPRAVREVLPQLHAQAVGPRPVGARRHGDRARAGPHQPRRSLLHRHLPGDAAARLHADVRAHARAPEHQDPAQHRLPRDRGRDPVRAR